MKRVRRGTVGAVAALFAFLMLWSIFGFVAFLLGVGATLGTSATARALGRK